MSIHQLRADGPDILNVHAPVQCATFRAEIELACKELILHHGPGFIKALLENKTKEIGYAIWKEEVMKLFTVLMTAVARMLEEEYDSVGRASHQGCINTDRVRWKSDKCRTKGSQSLRH